MCLSITDFMVPSHVEKRVFEQMRIPNFGRRYVWAADRNDMFVQLVSRSEKEIENLIALRIKSSSDFLICFLDFVLFLNIHLFLRIVVCIVHYFPNIFKTKQQFRSKDPVFQTRPMLSQPIRHSLTKERNARSKPNMSNHITYIGVI